MNSTTFLHSTTKLWNRLVEPHAAVTDPDTRHQSRLLAGILLAVLLVIVTVMLPRYLLISDATTPDRIAGAVMGMAAVLVSYKLARNGQYMLAGKLVVVLASVIIFVAALATPPNVRIGMLYYTMVLTLFSSLFLSVRFTFITGAAHILGMLLFPLLETDISLRMIAEGPAAFSLLLMLITLIFAQSRKSLEQQGRARLTESENRYRIISELMSDYAYCLKVEPDGSFVREWSTGDFKTSPIAEEMKSGETIILQDPEESGRFQLDMLAVMRGQSGASEYRVKMRDGEQRWLYIYRRPVRDPKTGRVERIYGVVQDITDRKQAETERLDMALQRERLRLAGHFVEAVSHDFRTALATIETNRYLIQQTVSGEGKTDRRLDHIHQAVEHITEQIENFKSLSSLIALNAYPYPVNDLIQGIAARFQTTAEKHGLSVTVRTQPDLGKAKIDADQIERALWHLLNNALNFTPEGGSITLETRLIQQHVAIIVQDTGIGIAQEDLPHVFDFFYRADPARSLNSGGVGLGLSIARMIVEAHSGTLRVSSTQGAGSTFTMTLPAA